MRFSDLRSDDRKGMDYTFSAPKSVSLQALIAGDAGVTAAHDRAVKRAVQQLEKLAHARIKEQGQSYRVRNWRDRRGCVPARVVARPGPAAAPTIVANHLRPTANGAMSNEDIQHSIRQSGRLLP